MAGIDVGQDPMAARRHIGFFPSADRTFYNRISGLENLAFFGRMYGIRRQEALARARRRLVDVGLSDAVDQRVGLYSHGMQKRLSMARALLMDPPVLVIDEATDGLDPEGARRVQDLTRSIAARRHRRDLDDPEAGRDPRVRRRGHRARPGPHHLPGHRRGSDAEVERARVSAAAANRRLDARRRRAAAGWQRRWAIAARWHGWASTASTFGSTWPSTPCWARCWPIYRQPVSSCSTVPSSGPNWRSRSCG